MRLTTDSIKNLNALLETCSTANIDNLLIEDGKVRGVNDDKTVVIISSQNLPDFGELKVGFSKLNTLRSRLDIVNRGGTATIDAKLGNNGEVSQLDLAGGGAKVQFRCAAPNTIKAPKAINDILSWEFNISAEAINLVSSGTKSMGSKRLVLLTRDGAVTMECTDTNSDVFTAVVADTVTWIRTDAEATKQGFDVHSYVSDELLPLLKAALVAGVTTVKLGEAGTLHIDINGHRLTVIPKIGD